MNQQQATTKPLCGTAAELGERIFDDCAHPALRHMLREMNRALPEQMATRQRLMMWAGFFASAAGAVLADCGHPAANELFDQIKGLVDELEAARNSDEVRH